MLGLTDNMCSKGFDVGFIHLEHYRSHDQIDREHQAEAFLATDHDSFHIYEGPAYYTDFPALVQVGMRLRPQARGHARLKRSDLGVRNRGGLTLKGHES